MSDAHKQDRGDEIDDAFIAGAEWARKQAEEAILAIMDHVKAEYGDYYSYAPEYEGLNDAIEAIRALR